MVKDIVDKTTHDVSNKEKSDIDKKY